MNRVSLYAVLLLSATVVACGEPNAGDAGAGNASGGTTESGGGGTAGSSTGGAGSGGGGTSSGGAGGSASEVRACKDTSASQPPWACRDVVECGPVGPVKCCTTGACWPASACPIPPTNCPTEFPCTTNADCGENGTCERSVMGCPQCEERKCVYPPPACTQSPDNCGDTARCQADGRCAPLLCDDGYTCLAGTRCAKGSARANEHGCEPIPCDDGWTCTENTRCTSPVDPWSHGCTALACQADTECDCGYCVNGVCQSNLGMCSHPPS